jgi:hypothetical protein
MNGRSVIKTMLTEGHLREEVMYYVIMGNIV